MVCCILLLKIVPKKNHELKIYIYGEDCQKIHKFRPKYARFFFFNIGKNPKTFKFKIYFLLKIILNAPNYPFGDRYKTQI